MRRIEHTAHDTFIDVQTSREFGVNDDFREEIGWPELVETIAGIHASLPPEEQAHAGAIHRLGL
jgi:hypothetical protein